MNIRTLRTFLEIASQRSFAKAATRLNYAQSSITAQVKALEGELGKELFVRGRSGVALTPAGESLLPYAQQMIELDAGAKDAVQSVPLHTGRIVISSAESISAYRLPKFLRHFQKMAPGAQITFKELLDREIFASLKAGTTDAAFVVGKHARVGFAGSFMIGSERASLYVGRGHALATKRPTIEELARQRFLLWGQRGSYIDAFEAYFATQGHPSLLSMDMINIETIKQCAKEGAGVALLLDAAVQGEVAREELVRLDWDMPDRFQSYLLWNKQKHLSPTVEFFIQTCREFFSEKQ